MFRPVEGHLELKGIVVGASGLLVAAVGRVAGSLLAALGPESRQTSHEASAFDLQTAYIGRKG